MQGGFLSGGRGAEGKEGNEDKLPGDHGEVKRGGCQLGVIRSLRPVEPTPWLWLAITAYHLKVHVHLCGREQISRMRRPQAYQNNRKAKCSWCLGIFPGHNKHHPDLAASSKFASIGFSRLGRHTCHTDARAALISKWVSVERLP